MQTGLVKAALVYDQKTLTVPEEMGTPRKDQLQGTPAEQLVELAGRVCYDSLGVGRDSVEYHRHIIDVGHLSVQEHFTFTVLIQSVSPSALLHAVVNRPGVYTVPIASAGARITCNLRAIVEWERWTPAWAKPTGIGNTLRWLAHDLAPQIVSAPEAMRGDGKLCRPMYTAEKHVTLFLQSSRGVSHEQVRHRINAISQRSTRYVDESDSPWVAHPLLVDYLRDTPDDDLVNGIDEVEDLSRKLYQQITGKLQDYATAKGLDKLTARKQARGAARGFLGNALLTNMIFTASVEQWQCILSQRLHPAADAEMQELAGCAAVELRKSQYAEHFTDSAVESERRRIAKVIARMR